MSAPALVGPAPQGPRPPAARLPAALPGAAGPRRPRQRPATRRTRLTVVKISGPKGSVARVYQAAETGAGPGVPRSARAPRREGRQRRSPPARQGSPHRRRSRPRPARPAALARPGPRAPRHVRDVTCGEGASRIRTGAAPRAMATMRDPAVGLIRRAEWNSVAAAAGHAPTVPQPCSILPPGNASALPAAPARRPPTPRQPAHRVIPGERETRIRDGPTARRAGSRTRSRSAPRQRGGRNPRRVGATRP